MRETLANGALYQYIPELAQYTKPAHETCTKRDLGSQTCTLRINQLYIIFFYVCYSIQSLDFTRLLSSLGR